MKKYLLIIGVFLIYMDSFAQKNELTLRDLLFIHSQEKFERLLIENNFQRANLEELGWKDEIEKINNKDTLILVYSFADDNIFSNIPDILASGIFLKNIEKDSNNMLHLKLFVIKPQDSYSFYHRIYNEVKEKCIFDEVRHSGEDSVAFYNCSVYQFNSEIGFSIDVDGFGRIIIYPPEPLNQKDSLIDELEGSDDKEKTAYERKGKNLDALMGGFSDGDPNASGYYGIGADGSGGNYRLGNRKAIAMPVPNYPCNEEGTVMVTIFVNHSGKVISALPGAMGTTNSAPCLLNEAKKAAMNSKFNADSEAPSKQVGEIIYNFSISD